MRVEDVELDLPATAAAFGRQLRSAGLAVGPDRAVRFAHALALARPVSRRRLYWTARAVFVSDRTEVRAFDAVFAAVFGTSRDTREDESRPETVEPASADARRPEPRTSDPAAPPEPVGVAAASAALVDSPDEAPPRDLPFGLVASDEEVLRSKRFDALTADELAQLHRLMSELALATPVRRARRSERRRHGSRIDMRRTLRASMRTAGDPVRVARRERRLVRRRIVLLCDISGSMEPYARAYLQFLVCAAGAGPRAEAFVFATRLTRVTRALASRHADAAIARAAATAPDWSSGTRIGDALKQFNDQHGRRGMARGAVLVILSDGWERGDPALVGRELERLSRLAYRIVWVNPRAAAPGFSPRTGGMAAALPHCDALVSGHSLDALSQVAAAIAAPRAVRRTDAPLPAPEDELEPWASATPVSGSSVAMPSGYGPSRGRTTPGWGPGDGRRGGDR